MESRRKSARAASRKTSVDSKEKDQAAASVDCDHENISSDSSSLTECKVVLDRLSSASFNTRSRHKSTLTVDNVAAMDSPAKGKQSKASESIASDDTGLSRTRLSTRRSTTQNTPKKEAKSTTTRAAAATPTRRTSRLVENIDLTNSPAIPAKRALRSNSVASEDLPPATPSTRRSTRSTRLPDTQGTPIKSKVESESVMTPGRKGSASRFFNLQVQEIKEEEIETVSIIDHSSNDHSSNDISQSSSKPKSKKGSSAKSETQISNAESDASSKKTETTPIDTIESEGGVLLMQTSTANMNQLDKSTEHVAQSDSETVKKANKSSDAITETAKPLYDLNAGVDKSVVGENAAPIASIRSEKSSVENKMAKNVKTDAIIVDESTLGRQKVDSINVNSSNSGQPEIPKLQSETSMESVLVIDQSADIKLVKGTDVIEKSSTLKIETPLMKSQRADLDFMFQNAASETPVSSKLALTPKQMKESNVSGTDQVKKSQTPKQDQAKPKTPSKNDLSLMNVTELVNSPKPDMSGVTLPSNQSKSPKTQTPSKNISEFADMDVTNINSPSTLIIEMAAFNKELTPQQKSQTVESANIVDLMNVTELVDSPKPKQAIQVAIEKQSLKPNTPSKSATKSVDTDVTESSDANNSGAKGIEIETPKNASSKQNTPKSTPVSDKIATPKNKTPKAKTPSKDLNEFGDINVAKLVEEVTVKTATPKKAEENVPASVPETVTKYVERVEMDGANKPIAKFPSSTKKTTTPKKSPLSSTLADQSINFNLEISKIYESLQSPIENMEPKKPDIFAIPIDDGKTLDDTVEPMEVDQTQIGNMTTTSIDEQPDNQLDAEDNNVSNLSVSSRKSVQIMTPKVAKNTSGLNRLGTPYPNKNEINAALAREEEIRKTADRFMGYVKDYQEKLKPLSESWNRSHQPVSTDKAGTSGIDKLVNKKDQLDEQPAKVAAPARNNWSVTKGLIDSDSEPDNIPETENEDEQSEEESVHSGLLDDKAEVIDDYESGDSEDEEDRQYRKENELKHKAFDLGSDDTDDSENEDDDYDSLDSFIVKETDEEIQDLNPDDTVRNESVVPRRRFSRIIAEFTSSDEEEQIVSVSMDVVHQEVVVFGQDDQNSEANPIVEGKTFETTIFKKSDEEDSVPMKQEKSNETKKVESQVENESMVMSEIAKVVELNKEIIQQDESNEPATSQSLKEINGDEAQPTTAQMEIENTTELNKEIIQQDESNEPATSQSQKEINGDEAQPTTAQMDIENTTESPMVQKDDKIGPCDSKSDQTETVHESNESDVSTNSLKENETAQINIPKKMNRISLPGIKTLPDSARKMAKEMNRKSLGNLVTNQQVLTVAPSRVLTLTKNQTLKASKQAKPIEPVPEKSTTKSDDVEANTSAKSIDSKVASSQEENNNKKKVKKSKAKVLAKKSVALSITQPFEEQDNVADDVAVPCSSKSTMSVDSGDLKNSMKQKVEFVEIETEAEPSTPPRKPVKYLNIIESRSGKFIEEPITPEQKDRFGFKVTPITPINKAFSIEKLNTNGTNEQVNKCKKRKIVYVEEPAIVLPKPHWNVEQDNVQPKKRARNITTGATEMIIRPLNEKKRTKSARDLIPVELQRFRERNLYRAGIPRQDSRSLLMDRMKRLASQK